MRRATSPAASPSRRSLTGGSTFSRRPPPNGETTLVAWAPGEALAACDEGDAIRSLSVAVVGLGYWRPNLVRNLQELADADVPVVCDVRRESLEGLARRYPSVRLTTSYDDVLADDRVDAVAIATPAGAHHPLPPAPPRAGQQVF